MTRGLLVGEAPGASLIAAWKTRGEPHEPGRDYRVGCRGRRQRTAGWRCPSGTPHAQIQLVFRYLEGSQGIAAAIALGERIISDVHRVLGADHEDLRTLRATLILAYAAARYRD